MVITLDPKLEAALQEAASRSGVAPEELALKTLRGRFLTAAVPQPRDEWERALLSLAKNCGASLPDSALSREAMYD